jgi:uncharacterized membrane protein
MDKKFKQDTGVAGLTILLSLIVMLFVIGLLVMIFSIMGAKLETSTYDTTTGTVTNESLGIVTNSTNETLAYSTLRDVVCSVSSVNNATGGEILTATNYTAYPTECKLILTATSLYNGTSLNVSYSYTYEADNTATGVMNDTVHSVASTTDWFDIFIVIGAMVVLILLTVIIITAIRSSGMIDGAGSQQNTVGTA